VRLNFWALAGAFHEREAVDADRKLDDLLHAVGGAGFDFRLLDPARCIGEVGELVSDAVAEELHAGARAGRFDDRRLEGGIGLPKRSATAVVNG
jgi:hypothetical protein